MVLFVLEIWHLLRLIRKIYQGEVEDVKVYSTGPLNKMLQLYDIH